MAEDRFLVEVDDRALRDLLGAAITGLQHPAELMGRIGGVLERNVNLRFITKTDPSGVPWAPLAASTLARKAGRGSLLELSGMMLSSLSVNAYDTMVEVGFGQGYAGYHETGSKDGTLPQRAMLFGDWQTGELGRDDREDVIAEIAAYLGELGR